MPGRPPRGVLLAALLLALPAAPAVAAEHTIAIGPGNQYATTTLTVAHGDTVHWEASGSHPLRFDGESGQYTSLYTRTLAGPRTVAFYCAVHGGPGGEGMSGVITVQAPANAPPTITLARETASPSADQPVAFRATAGDPEGQPVRIDWDLDGNGTFELTGGGSTASSRYAAGSHTVTARAVDPAGASAMASLTFTVAGAPGGTGAAGGDDTTAPTVRVKVARDVALRTLRRRGVRVGLTPSEDGTLSVTLRDVSGRRLGKATAPGHAGVRVTLRVRARRAQRGRLKLRVTVTDGAGNRRAVTRGLRVR